MRTFYYTVKIPVGLHARHAGMVVKEAGQYASAVTIGLGDRRADAKRIFALMNLGVKQGDLLHITVEGEDEDEACRKLKAFFFSHF